MIRKYILAAMVMLLSGTAMAQQPAEAPATAGEPAATEVNTDRNGWFITAALGPQIYFSDHDKQMKFGQRISPALDIAVGKWFKPWVGMRLMYSGVQLRGATQNGSHSTGEDVEGKGGYGYWLKKQKFGMFNIHLDAMFDMTQLLGKFVGYDANKGIYGLVAYAGLGMIGTCDTPKDINVSGNFGLFNTFRITENWALNLDLRGTLMTDSFDNEYGGNKEGILSLTAGATYTF